VPDLIAAVRSLLTYVLVSLYVIVIGPPLLLFCLAIGSPVLLYRIGVGGVRLGLWLSGIRIHVRHRERILHDRAAVYAVNHTSNVEPPVIFSLLSGLFPKLRILYKAELRRLPILVRAFDLAGFIPLERGNRDQSLPAIERAADALRDGNSFLLFPKARAAGPGSCCRSRRGASSWRPRRRRRSCRSPSAARGAR